MGRDTINGTQSQFSCKKTIPLDMWDVKGNCAKGRSKEALQINRELDNIKAQIIKHYQHLSDREAFVTAEMVRNSYQDRARQYYISSGKPGTDPKPEPQPEPDSGDDQQDGDSDGEVTPVTPE